MCFKFDVRDVGLILPYICEFCENCHMEYHTLLVGVKEIVCREIHMKIILVKSVCY
jgi:hypothetical protein